MLQHFSTWYTKYQCEYCGTSACAQCTRCWCKGSKMSGCKGYKIVVWVQGLKNVWVQGSQKVLCKGYRRCWCKGHNIIEEDQQSSPGPVWTGSSKFLQRWGPRTGLIITRQGPGLDQDWTMVLVQSGPQSFPVHRTGLLSSTIDSGQSNCTCPLTINCTAVPIRRTVYSPPSDMYIR
jgi:hypothetical protein